MALEKDLLSDDKELSEHIMLVDLGRNDVGKVRLPATMLIHVHVVVFVKKGYLHTLRLFPKES